MAVREPTVAGSFYPADASALRKYCEAHIRPRPPLVKAKAVILPHAGYMYSGETACQVVSKVRVPKANFLMGPNHHGIGADFAVTAEGEWETPLGRVRIRSRWASALLKACPELVADPSAHEHEHSLEVEVPFLQMRNPDLEIVPLVVGTLDLVSARGVARACAPTLASQDDAMVVVSTDMTHYENDRSARDKDGYALRAIENLDEKALEKAVKSYRITMCGFVPVYMLLAMKDLLGIQKATLVDYRTSAEASGDFSHVVGYAGFIFE